MKVLVLVDSFKGSLSSAEIAYIISENLPGLEVTALPVADGGEGTLDMLAEGKEKINVPSQNALGEEIESYFLKKDETAYIELANTAGLTLLPPQKRKPLLTHTFGVGIQMAKAIQIGCKEIIVFAGGSATNEAGLGALQALGFKFFDANGDQLKVHGQNLEQVKNFHTPTLPKGINFKVATDVTNPFTGSNGASHVYAPQKGASDKEVEQLENGLLNITKLFPESELQNIPGTGAAGGFAGGMHLFLHAEIVPATSLLFAHINLKQHIEEASYIITGEGTIDLQTLNGKLISRITEISNNKKVILISGSQKVQLNSPNICYSAQLKQPGMSTSFAIEHAAQLLKEKTKEILEFIREDREK